MSNRRVGRLALVSLLVLPTALVAAGAGLEEGTATGQLVVGGKQTALSHAYARAQPGMFDKTKERIVGCPLRRPPLSAGGVPGAVPGLKLAAKGKAHVVSVELNAEKAVTSGSILHDAFAATESFCGAGTHVFKAKAFDAKVVEGTLGTEKPVEFKRRRSRVQGDIPCARPAPDRPPPRRVPPRHKRPRARPRSPS